MHDILLFYYDSYHSYLLIDDNCYDVCRRMVLIQSSHVLRLRPVLRVRQRELSFFPSEAAVNYIRKSHILLQ